MTSLNPKRVMALITWVPHMGLPPYPEVRAAVQRASFELLIGFQLTQEQLEYNVRR